MINVTHWSFRIIIKISQPTAEQASSSSTAVVSYQHKPAFTRLNADRARSTPAPDPDNLGAGLPLSKSPCRPPCCQPPSWHHCEISTRQLHEVPRTDGQKCTQGGLATCQEQTAGNRQLHLTLRCHFLSKPFQLPRVLISIVNMSQAPTMWRALQKARH